MSKKEGGKGKKVAGYVKFTILAGKATPSPPVGPALAAKKVNIPEFCKQFNDRSVKEHEIGTPLPVEVTAYTDGTFTFHIKNPPSSYLIMKQMGGVKGLSDPGKSKGPSVNVSDLLKVAKVKMKEMRVTSEKAALMSIIGTAKSAGFTIVEDITVEK